MKFRFTALLLTTILSTTACASKTEESTDTRSDPFQGFNRVMFDFNRNVLDTYVVRPAAVFWRDYVPQPARNGLSNLSSNLSEPASMVNNLLKGEGHKAAINFSRFFLNTVFGLGGFIDVAGMSNPELRRPDPAQFGQTLGYYGVGNGPYLVLPGYGPATITQDGADYVDYLYAPLNLLTFWTSMGRWAIDGLEMRAKLLDQDKIIDESTDPYLFIREAYFQRKAFLINGGKVNPTENKNAAELSDVLDEIDG